MTELDNFRKALSALLDEHDVLEDPHIEDFVTDEDLMLLEALRIKGQKSES